MPTLKQVIEGFNPAQRAYYNISIETVLNDQEQQTLTQTETDDVDNAVVATEALNLDGFNNLNDSLESRSKLSQRPC